MLAEGRGGVYSRKSGCYAWYKHAFQVVAYVGLCFLSKMGRGGRDLFYLIWGGDGVRGLGY